MATVFLHPVDSSVSVTDAISSASRATGVDFRYLLDTASRESSLNPGAKAAKSSATGLFQFVDQTWLATLKAHGAEHGLATEADLITEARPGKFSVADPDQRQAILALRKDPRVSALMAGEFARDTRGQLENILGRPVDNSELYLAHVFGPKEAARFISEADWGGDGIAATSFPGAASSNHGLFYDGSGRARTLAEVKASLTRIHGAAPSPSAPPADIPAGLDMTAAIPQMRLPTFSDPSEGEETAPVQQMAFLPPVTTSTLRLTPQILEILSSLDPLGQDKQEQSGLSSALSSAIGN